MTFPADESVFAFFGVRLSGKIGVVINPMDHSIAFLIRW